MLPTSLLTSIIRWNSVLFSLFFVYSISDVFLWLTVSLALKSNNLISLSTIYSFFHPLMTQYYERHFFNYFTIFHIWNILKCVYLFTIKNINAFNEKRVSFMWKKSYKTKYIRDSKQEVLTVNCDLILSLLLARKSCSYFTISGADNYNLIAVDTQWPLGIIYRLNGIESVSITHIELQKGQGDKLSERSMHLQKPQNYFSCDPVLLRDLASPYWVSVQYWLIIKHVKVTLYMSIWTFP